MMAERYGIDWLRCKKCGTNFYTNGFKDRHWGFCSEKCKNDAAWCAKLAKRAKKR